MKTIPSSNAKPRRGATPETRLERRLALGERIIVAVALGAVVGIIVLVGLQWYGCSEAGGTLVRSVVGYSCIGEQR